MAQDFRTWFRGKDGLVTRLLPDDTAGLLAMYGIPGARKPLDISRVEHLVQVRTQAISER